jgi:hypothetical protein
MPTFYLNFLTSFPLTFYPFKPSSLQAFQLFSINYELSAMNFFYQSSDITHLSSAICHLSSAICHFKRSAL